MIYRSDNLLDKYKYTDKEVKDLLKTMVILVDTREKKNQHILSYFDKLGVKYETKAFTQGDYSFCLPKSEEYNIPRDLHFDKEVCIERKASLEEYSTNLTKHRQRLKNEFSSYCGDMLLVIENGTYSDIAKGKFDTNFEPISYISSLHSVSTEFGVPFIFIDSEYSGMFIYLHFYYYLRNLIKK